MRARVARLLRALAHRIDGPQRIVINFNMPPPMTPEEMAAFEQEWTQTYGERWAN